MTMNNSSLICSKPGVVFADGETELERVEMINSYIESCTRDTGKKSDGGSRGGGGDEKGDVEEYNAKKLKIESIMSYLESCGDMKTGGATPDDHEKKNNRRELGQQVTDREDTLGDSFSFECPPEKNRFWRDGEEVFTDDAHDGLSTDFRVRIVYLNIAETLKAFASCADIGPDIAAHRKLKDFLRALRYEMDTAAGTGQQPAVVTVRPAERASRLMSNLRNLVLAADTSKGARRLVVNQMDPYTCRVSVERLQELCRFGGFSEYNDKYGTLGCKFYLPIKLLFLGNLVTKHFDRDDGDSSGGNGRGGEEAEHRGYTVYNLEISHHFGSYFYEFLENLYDVCFEKLTTELRRYKDDKSKQRRDSSSSLAALSSRRCDTHSADLMLDALDEFHRRDSVKTLGTSGRLNQDTRLRYIRFDKSTSTLVEDEPVEESDAVFVSSYIGVRINREGQVCMDVYARHALLLELYTGDGGV